MSHDLKSLCRPFRKVLVANRGEIALRVMRTCKALGYATVAVYSEADAHSPHVAFADEAVQIGGANSSESYLSIARIIAACKQSQADAVHPGYGFLSENPDFADACLAHGIVLIGPSPDSMRALGNKAAAKDLLSRKCPDVPLIPGYSASSSGSVSTGNVEDDADLTKLSPEALQAAAERVGYPLLCKAAAGGGGRGLRIIREPSSLLSGIQEAMSEAKSSFADSRILLERYFDRSHHIEFQIVGDSTGRVIELGERECSVQRRYQKVIEESPSSFISPQLRKRMAAAACQVGRACNYLGVGTVEFLVDDTGNNFYFLEVNTRLQVEHPITELTHTSSIAGHSGPLDLVAIQLRIAAGESLSDIGLKGDQDWIAEGKSATRGHAIECRLYAEDPANGFFPSTGRVLAFYAPGIDGAAPQEGIRIDSGIRSGSDVTVYYDPLLAKVIAYGETREEARRRLIRALGSIVVFGVITNKTFLVHVLQSAAFQQGGYNTAILQEHVPPSVFAQSLKRLLLSPAADASAKEQQRALSALQEIYIASVVASVLARKIQYENYADTTARLTVPTGWRVAPLPKRFTKQRVSIPYLANVHKLTAAKSSGEAGSKQEQDVASEVLIKLDKNGRVPRYQPFTDLNGDPLSVWYQIDTTQQFTMGATEKRDELSLRVKFEDAEERRQLELILGPDVQASRGARSLSNSRERDSASEQVPSSSTPDTPERKYVLGTDEHPIAVTLHHFAPLITPHPTNTHLHARTIHSLSRADPVLLDIGIQGVRKRFIAALDETAPDFDEDDPVPVWVQHVDPQIGAYQLIRASRFDADGCWPLKAFMANQAQRNASGASGGAGGAFEMDIKAPMPCKVVKLVKSSSDLVNRREVVIVVESMKMELRLESPMAGSIQYFAQPGQVVKEGAKLAVVRRMTESKVSSEGTSQ